MHYIIASPLRYFSSKLPQKELFYENLYHVFTENNIKHTIINLKSDTLSSNFPSDKYKLISYHTTNPDNFNVKIGHIPDWFYFDRYGYNGWSEYAIKKPEYEKVPDNYADLRFKQIRKYIIGKEITKIHQSQDDIPDCDDFIFVALQTLVDPVNSLMWRSWNSLIDNLMELKTTVVIKLHPNCSNDAVKRKLNKIVDNKRIFQSNASIHKLISASRAVITGNSGVGFESLLFLKPVFAYGHSDYRWVTYNNIPFDRIFTLIDNFSDNDITHIKKFVVDYLDNYMINVYDKDSYLRRFKQVGIL